MKKVFLTLLICIVICAALVSCGDEQMGVSGNGKDDHVFGEWVDEVPATCTEKGTVGYYYCEHCSGYFNANKQRISLVDLEIPSTGHNFPDGFITNVEETCTQDGSKSHYHCVKCNKDFDFDYNELDTIVIPAGHKYGTWVDEVAADCENEGVKGHYQCTVCEKYFDTDKHEISDLTLSITDHNYGDWIDEVAADCENDGVLGHYNCSVCDKNFDEDKELLSDIVIPASHTYGDWINEISKECLTNGTKGHYHCSGCDKDFDEDKNELTDLVIPAGHTYGTWIEEIEADCDVNGTLGHYHCSGCDKDFDEDKNELTDLVIPAGHTYGTWIEEVEASCAAEGTLGHYHCSGCGKDFDEDKNELGSLVIPQSGHTYGTWIEEIAAECEANGTLGHYHCSVCHKDFDEDKNELTDIVIPATNHNYVDGSCEYCSQPEPSEGLDFTLSDDGTYYILSGIGDCTDLDICVPSTYNGLPVKEVLARAFKNNYNIKSIILPNTITKIGDAAFYQCYALTYVQLPESLVSIGESAFRSCYGLVSITIPSNVQTINQYAFYECLRLVEVFNKSDLSIRANEQYYGYVSAYADNVYTPENGESRLEIVDGFIIYKDNILMGYVGSDINLTLPSCVTSIGKRAFAYSHYYSAPFVTMEIPESVITIEEHAFYRSESLKIIKLADSVQTIGFEGFWGATGLVKITLGTNLVSIGTDAFVSTSIDEIYNRSSLGIQLGKRTYGEIAYNAQNLYTPETGSSQITVDDDGFVIFGTNKLIGYIGTANSIVIPDSIVIIDDLAIPYNTNLVSVELGENVVTIGSNAFRGCLKLREIKFNDNLSVVGSFAFEKTSLEYVIIPTSITSMDTGVFNNLQNFTAYYKGTPEQWNSVSIGSINTVLTGSLCYYSETEPTDTENTYWHFDTDENPVKW